MSITKIVVMNPIYLTEFFGKIQMIFDSKVVRFRLFLVTGKVKSKMYFSRKDI